MRIKNVLLAVAVLLSLFSCHESANEEKPQNDLEVIEIDLSKAREGKLSEFFEPEIEYIWLNDEEEEGQLNAGLQKILFHEDKILTLDVFGCRCIKIFDRESGDYISKIRAYGEGPGKYLDLDGMLVVQDEILVYGIYPFKLMLFDFEGNLIHEQKTSINMDSGVYDPESDRFYFYHSTSDTEAFRITGIGRSTHDTTRSLPIYDGFYYGNHTGRESLIETDQIYLAEAFNDTIRKLEDGKFMPELVFDYGSYGQELDEYIKLSEELDGLEFMNFINKKAKLYFMPDFPWYVDSFRSYSFFKYERTAYNIFYNRANAETHVINWQIENDLDHSIDLFGISYHFGNRKTGVKIPGTELYKILYEMRDEMSEEEFKEYINGKGKAFAEVAVKARKSENPVLMVLTWKK